MIGNSNASTDLLFGLLALQIGLIDQAKLVAAFQAWTLDEQRPLAEHLVAMGHLDSDDRAAVAGLVAHHLKRHGGDAEKSLAAVRVDPSIRRSLAAVTDAPIDTTLIGLDFGPDADPDRTASYAVGAPTSDGQRFRILRPHARGGLGAVFVALDQELHREVALKQILESHADDPTSRARFLLEAEITGGMEHPGVVPVYGLGSYADGRPYYAMRLIRGDCLKEAVGRFHADETLRRDPGRRSLELRRLLRRFTDVCNAIEYAHSRGVLHRDIKPGNIIVGKHGETLVIDWGLAKATGQSGPGAEERTLIPSSAGGSAETSPGSALGTPAYMSPEQASGDLDRLGPPSDVYSLGATLYCLLTGQPPYTGDDAGSVLRAAQRGEFRPPRAIDPAIDPALEAVCRKAMALEPQDRYGSPRALVEEVERWMADEPVSAWREPLGRRARRWARRNRTAVTAAAVALLAGVVGLSAVLVVQTHAKADIARALASETRANAALGDANTKVQARYQLAMEAIKTFHTGASEDFLLKHDQFKEVRNRLLKSAADFYGKLSALLGKETDVGSRRALAAANFELAELTGMVGRREDALAAHRSVLAAREYLASEPGAGAKARVEVGRSLLAVAGLLEATGQTAEALAEYRRAEALLAGLAGTEAEARTALAACRSRMASLLSTTGENVFALAAYRLARSEQEALATAPGASNDARRDLADTIQGIGILLSRTGQPASAEAEYREALAIQQKLADDNPAVTQFRSRLATSHNNLGILLLDTGRPAEAEAEYREARAIQQKLAEENPAVTDFRSRLADSHNHLGNLLSNTGRSAEAEAAYREARAIQQKLADDNPAVTMFRSRLADIHDNLGLLLSRTGRPAEAEAEHRTGLALNRKLVDDNPNIPGYRNHAATVDNNLSVVLRRLGRPAEARDHGERAVAARELLVRKDPKTRDYRARLPEDYLNRGLARRALGDPAGAAADLRRALGLFDALPSRAGEVFVYACCHAALSGLGGRADSGVSAHEASSEAEAAMTLLHKAVDLGYRNPAAYRTEDALDPLRARDDFRLLMMDLAMPAAPFAPAR